ncbi:MAG: UDP-3-O-(3-hydroxymyristoyl)glucosamine N-acyltransferase [Ginsengibacter sp.]
MKFSSPVSVNWIASFINARLLGNENILATGINELHNVQAGDIAFVDHPKYYAACLNSAATIIIINMETDVPEGKTLLIVAEPFEAYLKLVQHFHPFSPSAKMISDSALIGHDTLVMPNVFIGNRVTIGNRVLIHPNVTIYDDCTIGDDVVIQAGTVIGSDAFYFNTKKNRDLWYKKMDSCGRVIIGSHVEIGAGCTIDRGVSADTIIGQGTKFDNMIHIGHDVVIGKNCLVAAQVGIAGCTVVGDGVTMWGQAGISKTLVIGDNAVVLAQSGVGENIAANQVYFGTPAGPALQKQKELVWIKRIPEIWAKINPAKPK